jgi:hypothetical protein
MKDAINWRVKHERAKTVYTIQCDHILTLTVEQGQPIHPSDADFVSRAERRDVPEQWALWGQTKTLGWQQSTHDTKAAASAALRANRLTPPPIVILKEPATRQQAA